MTLGERLYAAAVATGAHPFAFPYGEGAKPWADLDEAQQARWEACAVMVDAATRADCVGQLRDISLFYPEETAGRVVLGWASNRLEAGRT